MQLVFYDAAGRRVDDYFVRDPVEAECSAIDNVKCEPGAFVLGFAGERVGSAREWGALAFTVHRICDIEGHGHVVIIGHDTPTPPVECDTRTSREIVRDRARESWHTIKAATGV